VAEEPPVLNVALDLARGHAGLVSVRDRLGQWLQSTGIREPALSELLIAVGEACTNSLEHSGTSDSDEGPGAWLKATHDQDLIRIVVRDRGRWKPPSSQSSARGRGRAMMDGLADELTIITGPTGTTVELTKLLR
jgi:anti-sigma regulatory factor (Ser/Thr protein kinase)